MSPTIEGVARDHDVGVPVDLDALRNESSVYDDLHVEARRVLDRNPEPRNLRDVAVALESMGYTGSGAKSLGFESVFDLAQAVFDLTYLYYVPRAEPPPAVRPHWRTFADDYLAGAWYGVPWILSVLVLFVGKVALWSSLRSTPQAASMISLAFFVAAPLAGACSQVLARKGTFYYLQHNDDLVRWVLGRVVIYGGASFSLVVAITYGTYVVPTYGLALGETFAEFAVAIFAFLLSSAPLFMLRRFPTLAGATGVAIAVTMVGARLTDGSTGIHRAQFLGLAVGAGAVAIAAASGLTLRRHLGRDAADGGVVKPPALRVVLWHAAPYAAYGTAYFAMILVVPLVVGLAFGRSLGVDQFVYPATFEGATDIALLELVLLLGLVHAFIERFGRRLRPLLESSTLDRWTDARAALRSEWRTGMVTAGVVAAVSAVVVPHLLLSVLPADLTAPVRTPGGFLSLQVAAVAYAFVPIGMLGSQYLFFLNRPSAPLLAAIAGTLVSAVSTAVAVAGGELQYAAWGLLAGTTTYAGIVLFASYRTLSAGEESYYASF